MDRKDNRNQSKRHKMKTHSQNKSKYYVNNNASSSSGQLYVNQRSVVDIVDSSDEHFVNQSRWYQNKTAMARDNVESEESVYGSRLSTCESTSSTSTVKQQQKHSVSGGGEVRARQSTPQQRFIPVMPEIESENSADFGLLVQYPPSVGSFFTFASEKHWEAAETDDFLDKSEAGKYFTLNIKLLNAGLQAIPFYKRMDYPAGLFTNEQRNTMEQEAESAEKLYQTILKEHLKNPKIKINSHDSTQQKAEVPRFEETTSVISPDNNPDNDSDKELDELLQMSTLKIAKIDLQAPDNKTYNSIETGDQAIKAEITNNTKDIQDWLDNVLEDD